MRGPRIKPTKFNIEDITIISKIKDMAWITFQSEKRAFKVFEAANPIVTYLSITEDFKMVPGSRTLFPKMTLKCENRFEMFLHLPA